MQPQDQFVILVLVTVINMVKEQLQVMFSNRKERSELLEALVISNKDNSIPKFPQVTKLNKYLSLLSHFSHKMFQV